MASSDNQRQTVVSAMVATKPRATAARQISLRVSCERGSPCSAGSSQASALIAITTSGGKDRGPAAAGALLQTGQALLE